MQGRFQYKLTLPKTFLLLISKPLSLDMLLGTELRKDSSTGKCG